MTIQEKQAESEKYEKAYDDGYEHGYAQARFDYEQEPKTGHWIKENPPMVERYPFCSECSFVNPFENALNYCPNCGAKMSEID